MTRRPVIGHHHHTANNRKHPVPCSWQNSGPITLASDKAWGHRIWAETDPHTSDRARVWQAVSWWSYHRPVWTVLASWLRPKLARVEPLAPDHPALIDAAKALQRIIVMP